MSIILTFFVVLGLISCVYFESLFFLLILSESIGLVLVIQQCWADSVVDIYWLKKFVGYHHLTQQFSMSTSRLDLKSRFSARLGSPAISCSNPQPMQWKSYPQRPKPQTSFLCQHINQRPQNLSTMAPRFCTTALRLARSKFHVEI